jgi:ferredoxin
MAAAGCRTIEEFITSTAGEPNVQRAGVVNAQRIVPALIENPRYHQSSNVKTPPKIDSHLELFDCITCYKCLPVCPNAANFAIPTGTADLPTQNYKYIGGRFETIPAENFVLRKLDQIANLADFCNECGDCDTYCPEHGGPFIEKPRFFFSEASYRKFEKYDGFYFPMVDSMIGRIQQQEYLLLYDEKKRQYLWRSDNVEFLFDAENRFIAGVALNGLHDGVEIDLGPFYIMRTLFDGIRNNPDDYTSVMLRGQAGGK